MNSIVHMMEHESVNLLEAEKNLQKALTIQEQEENLGLTKSCCKYNMLLLISK